MRITDWIKSLLTFGCAKTMLLYFKAEGVIYRLASNAEAHRFLLEKEYTKLKRLHQKAIYGYSLNWKQEELLGEMQKSNFSEEVIRALFISRCICKSGKVILYPKMELFLIFLLFFQSALTLIFIVGLTSKLYENHHYYILKAEIILFFFSILTPPLLILYELGLKNLLASMQERKKLKNQWRL
jgi:hypothetical protein